MEGVDDFLITDLRQTFWNRGIMALAVVAFALALRFAWADFQHTEPNTFREFYWAAQTLRAGGNVYTSHPPGDLCQYVYPPLFALILVPWTQLSLLAAQRLWLLLDVALTALALYLAAGDLARRFRLRGGAATRWLLAAGAFVLSAGEVKTEWSTAQTDTLILLAFVLGLRWLERAPWLAGLALGCGGNIKYQPLLALPWMLARRRWRPAVGTAVAAGGVALLPAFALGWGGNLRALGVALAGLGSFAGRPAEVAARTVKVTWIRSVSITSASARFVAAWHGQSLVAFALAGLVALLFLGLAWGMYRAHGWNLFARAPVTRDPRLVGVEWVGLMVGWLAFGPEVSRRHMFVLLLLHVTVLAVLTAPGPQRSRPWLGVALVIWQFGLRLPPSGATFQRASAFWNAVGGPSWCLLLLYATLLWSVLELLSRRPAQPSPAARLALVPASSKR